MSRALLKPERVPRPAFSSIEQLNRLKRIMLGLPVDKARATIPWGYSEVEGDSKKLVPNEKALRLLIKAKEYLRTCSLDEVARWLSADTGMKISDEGLRLILRDRCPFDEIMLEQDERERIYHA